MPSALMSCSTSAMPLGNLLMDGTHAPTVSHHPSPISVYQPESMQKYSAPARAGADKRDQSVRCRVARQRVHVVVEDHRETAVVLVGPPERPSVSRQAADGALEPSAAYGKRNGDRFKGFSRIDLEPPMVLGVRGSQESQVRRPGRAHSRVLAELPVPPAAVLDLPEHRVPGLPVHYGPHRQVRP